MPADELHRAECRQYAGGGDIALLLCLPGPSLQPCS